MSGRKRRWEWRPDTGDAEDGKTTSDASGRGARASDAGLIFADVPEALSRVGRCRIPFGVRVIVLEPERGGSNRGCTSG